WSGRRLLMVAQTRFRRLNAPDLLAKVYVGVRYDDGTEATGKEVAALVFTQFLTEPHPGTARQGPATPR
ncbi:MAG: hypothetical protein QN144_13755, partial [Armatimonadota bacterium]|nr:hypothetical protein [Armatimonadota bacterium]